MNYCRLSRLIILGSYNSRSACAMMAVAIALLMTFLFVSNVCSYDIKFHNNADCLAEVEIHFISSKHNQQYTFGVDEEGTFDTSHRCPRKITARTFAKHHTYSLKRCLNPYLDGFCEIACKSSRWQLICTGEEQYDLVKID